MPQVLLLHDPPFLEKEQWISLLFYPVCWPDIYFFPKPHHFIDNLGTNNAQVLFEKMGPNVAIIHYKPTSLSSVYLSSIFHFVRDSCKGKKKKSSSKVPDVHILRSNKLHRQLIICMALAQCF